jgi:hypothetical protein
MELNTFSVATDGVGYSANQEFYKTGFGFGFNQFFWVELGVLPPVVPPVVQTYGGGAGFYDRTQKPVVQQHYIKFYIKTPTGIVSTQPVLITPVRYKFYLKLVKVTELLPKFIMKQVSFVGDIYNKIKIRLTKHDQD